jgi:hypothetical protein
MSMATDARGLPLVGTVAVALMAAGWNAVADGGSESEMPGGGAGGPPGVPPTGPPPPASDAWVAIMLAAKPVATSWKYQNRSV